MKSIRFSLLGSLVLLLFACQKDLQDSSSNYLQETNGAKGPGGVEAKEPKGPVTPTLAISFSANPVKAGTEITISVTTDADCGKITIERAVDANGNYTTSALAADWEEYASKDVVPGVPTDFLYTPDTEGWYGFRAHFIPSSCGGTFKSCFASGDLEVLPACDGLSLEAELVSAELLGDGSHQFTVKYTVDACSDTYTNGKLQGGLTATALSLPPSPIYSDIKYTNQNTVLTWLEPTFSGKKEYLVVFKKILTGSAPYKLTGNWSFKAYDSNGVLVTVGYDNEISYTP